MHDQQERTLSFTQKLEIMSLNVRFRRNILYQSQIFSFTYTLLIVVFIPKPIKHGLEKDKKLAN